MNTNVAQNFVQIDPATLSAIQSLPSAWQHYALAAVALLTILMTLGRVATALLNDAPVLKSVLMGSVHANPVTPQIAAVSNTSSLPVQTVGVAQSVSDLSPTPDGQIAPPKV